MIGGDATLELRVKKTVGAFNLDLDVAAPLGAAVGLVGHSGSGKSTLLACIAGHLRPDAGRIALAGRVLFDSERRIEVRPAQRHVGLVFQEALLFPHMSVRANLLYGARGCDARLIAHVVDVLGLSTLLQRRTGALSGGERQRIALGRALLARPQLLLLDEPLASLDAARRDAALQLLADLAESAGMSMVYVSHAPNEVARLTKQIIRLAGGRILAPAECSEHLASA